MTKEESDKTAERESAKSTSPSRPSREEIEALVHLSTQLEDVPRKLFELNDAVKRDRENCKSEFGQEGRASEYGHAEFLQSLKESTDSHLEYFRELIGAWEPFIVGATMLSCSMPPSSGRITATNAHSLTIALLNEFSGYLGVYIRTMRGETMRVLEYDEDMYHGSLWTPLSLEQALKLAMMIRRERLLICHQFSISAELQPAPFEVCLNDVAKLVKRTPRTVQAKKNEWPSANWTSPKGKEYWFYSTLYPILEIQFPNANLPIPVIAPQPH